MLTHIPALLLPVSNDNDGICSDRDGTDKMWTGNHTGDFSGDYDGEIK